MPQQVPQQVPPQVPAGDTEAARETERAREAATEVAASAAGRIEADPGTPAPQQPAAPAAPPPLALAPTPEPAPLPRLEPTPAPPPFTIASGVDILDAIHAARDTSLQVDVDTGSGSVRIGSDRLRFRIKSNVGGLLHIFMVGTDGSHVYELFPNELDRDNRIEPDRAIDLPRPSWEMVAGGPPGRNEFVVIVTPVPRDFTGAGVQPGNPFGEFDLDAARRAAQASGPAALAGAPQCPRSETDCGRYAAQRFHVDEVAGP